MNASFIIAPLDIFKLPESFRFIGIFPILILLKVILVIHKILHRQDSALQYCRISEIRFNKESAYLNNVGV